MSELINLHNSSYLQSLLDEKDLLCARSDYFPHALRLLEQDIARVRTSMFRHDFSADLKLPEPNGEIVTMYEKVFIPKEPKDYNYVGRILGPRGMTAKELELQTGTKIQIRGRGSLRDEKKEALYRERPGWGHLHEELHVLIETEDTPNRARVKLGIVLEIIHKLFVIPPNGADELKCKQLMELAFINNNYRSKSRRSLPPTPKPAQYSLSPTFSPPSCLGRDSTLSPHAGLFTPHDMDWPLPPFSFTTPTLRHNSFATPSSSSQQSPLSFNNLLSEFLMEFPNLHYF